jgi:hypothetical protein
MIYVKGEFFLNNNKRVNLKKIMLINIIVSILIVLSYSTNQKILFVSIIIMVIAILLEKCFEGKLLYFLFFIPMSGAIWSIDGLSVSIYTILKLLSFATFVFCYVRQKKYIPRILIKSLGLIYLFVFYSVLISWSNYNFNWGLLINIGITYFIIALLVSGANEDSHKNYGVVFISGVLSSSILGYFSYLIPRLYNVVSNILKTSSGSGIVGVYRFSGMTYDPNLYSMYVLVAIAVLITLYINQEVGLFKFVIVSGTLSIFGLLSLSKAFILEYVLIMFIFYGYILFSSRVKKKILIFLTSIAAVIIIISSFGDYFIILLSRFGSMANGSYIDFDTLTTNRSYIWNIYLNNMNGISTIFGNGLGSELPLESTPHNLFIFLIYLFGIFGTVIFTLMLAVLVKSGREAFFVNTKSKGTKPNIIDLLPTLALFAAAQSIDIILAYDILILMVPVCIFSSTNTLNKRFVYFRREYES